MVSAGIDDIRAEYLHDVPFDVYNCIAKILKETALLPGKKPTKQLNHAPIPTMLLSESSGLR